jgi:hypothetical protein
MIWLARDQGIVVDGKTWIRVLSLQPETIRLSVMTQTSLHMVSCQTAHEMAMRITLCSVNGNVVALEVDAHGAIVEQFRDEPHSRDKMRESWNLVFITLRIGECVEFAESSEPATATT